MTAGHPDHDWVLNTPLTFDLNDVGKNLKDMTKITLTNRLLHFSDLHQKFQKACLKTFLCKSFCKTPKQSIW